jgi:hypothetical protein
MCRTIGYTLAVCGILAASVTAQEKPIPRQPKSVTGGGSGKRDRPPTFVVSGVEPANGSLLFAGYTYQVKMSGRMPRLVGEGLDITFDAYVHGDRLAPIKVSATTGVEFKGEWTWDVCASGCDVDIKVDVVGRGQKTGHKYQLATFARKYGIVYPCHCMLVPCR